MRKIKNTIPVLMLIMLLVGSCANKDENGAPSKTGSAAGGAIEWLTFNEGYALAQKEKKAMLVDVYADWCHWCVVMDKETFADADVVKKLKNSFVTIRVHTDKTDGEKISFNNMSLSNQDFASGMGVQGLPTLIFFDKQGKFLTKVPGFVKKDMLMMILDYLASECYNEGVTFDDYAHNKGVCKKR